MTLLPKKIILVTLLLFLFHSGVYSQIENGINTRTKQVIDSTYTYFVKKYKVEGLSLAIVDSGKIVYATGYGFSDKLNKKKADEKTIYRIGSCTKSFTALSLLQLQEKGLLDVNHSVKTYLPDLKISSRFNDNNQIFIKDMLCHVSALPCDVANGFFCNNPPNINWLISALNEQTTISPLRYNHAYSNVAYSLLGEVIHRVSKKSYNDYVRDNIFKPLNMTSSYIDYDSTLATQFSKGYYNGKELVEPLLRDAAAGLIHSNVIDMANYLNMYLGNGSFNNTVLVSPQSIHNMQQNQIGDITLKEKDWWGYGLYAKQIKVKSGADSSVCRLIGHGGDTYLYHADFGYIPELNVGVVLLTNSSNGLAINQASRLLKIYLKENKSKRVNFNYQPKADSLYTSGETVCTTEELLGRYNFGSFVMQVNSEKKMKFKQGPATIAFLPKKKTPGIYRARATLFHIIPVKVKDQEFKFVKFNGQTYVKVIFISTKNEEYIGVKSESNSIPETWINKCGNYEVTGKVFSYSDFPVSNFEGMQLRISQKKGNIVIETKGKSKDTKETAYLNCITDSLAVKGGIGRGTGDAVRLRPNGNIHYSGFEFRKIK